MCVCVCVCLSLAVSPPLWPDSTSARLIPAIPGMAGGTGSKTEKERNQLMEGSPFFGEGEMNRSVFTCRWFWIQIVSGLYVLISFCYNIGQPTTLPGKLIK